MPMPGADSNQGPLARRLAPSAQGEMSDISRRQARRQGFTLGRAFVLAVVLHLLVGALLTSWPGLLFPRPASAETEAPPLQFAFVDTPASEPPPEPPDAEMLSDIDRVAADSSPRDDQPLPFAEGNTAARVLRPAAVPIETLAAEAQPPVPESREESSNAPEVAPELSDREAVEVGAEPAEVSAETVVAEAETVTIPRRKPSLRSQLTQMESFVDPQVYDNREGGADDSEGLAQFDTRGYDLGPYLNEVLRRIEGHWRANMPPLVRTGVAGASFVALTIRRQANVSGDEVARIFVERSWPSGQPAYDAGAQFALQLSDPLPPIPDYYPYDDIPGRLGFIYNMGTADITFPDQR